VANHYERAGLKIWWTALALTHSVRHQSFAPIRWLSIDRLAECRVLGFVPVSPSITAAVIRLIARRYGMLLVSREDPRRRAPMLREARNVLHNQGHPIALFPEGIRASAGEGLAQAFESSGEVIAWLSNGRVPVIPAAVYEQGGRLYVRLGAPLLLDRRSARDGAGTTLLMERIASMLPAELRGAYAGMVE
jgi:hypothetical protein